MVWVSSEVSSEGFSVNHGAALGLAMPVGTRLQVTPGADISPKAADVHWQIREIRGKPQEFPDISSIGRCGYGEEVGKEVRSRNPTGVFT